MQPATVLSAAIATGVHLSAPSVWSYWLVIGLSVAMAIVDAWLFVWIIRSRHSGGDDDDGGGWRKGPVPPGPEPNGDPEWWPEFERQLNEYADRRLTGAS